MKPLFQKPKFTTGEIARVRRGMKATGLPSRCLDYWPRIPVPSHVQPSRPSASPIQACSCSACSRMPPADFICPRPPSPGRFQPARNRFHSEATIQPHGSARMLVSSGRLQPAYTQAPAHPVLLPLERIAPGPAAHAVGTGPGVVGLKFQRARSLSFQSASMTPQPLSALARACEELGAAQLRPAVSCDGIEPTQS